MRTPEQYYERETFFEWFMRECAAHEDERGRLPASINIELQHAALQHEEMCRDWFPQDRGFWEDSVARTRRYIQVLEYDARRLFPSGK